MKRVGLKLRRLGARTNWSLKHVMKSLWHIAPLIDYYYCDFYCYYYYDYYYYYYYY